LWPRATEQALWSLLPALALGLGALSLPPRLRRRLLQAVLGLVLASAAFAFFQLSLADASPLLLYTTWGRSFGGLFVNPNHQGTALILGAVIALALSIEARRSARDDQRGHRHWLYAFLAAACVAMVPLANGSAATLLVLVGLVLVALMMGVLRRRGAHGTPSWGLRVAALGLAAAVVVASALAWKQADVERQQIAASTVAIGARFAPLGTGVGSFVPVYAQSQDPRQARGEVINHAHNEYAQWWLEGGVPALLVLGFGLGLFGWCGWQVLTQVSARPLRAVAAPAWAGILLLLLHSLVDYPLRTTALMATAGLLAGLLLATLNDAGRKIRRRDHRDDAMPQA
jgi:O-antigen ligase